MTTTAYEYTEYRNGRAAAKAWAQLHDVKGRKGGWLYTAEGDPICHGWDSYVADLTIHNCIVGLDRERLVVLSGRRTGDGRELRNVFDGKPVLLRTIATIPVELFDYFGTAALVDVPTIEEAFTQAGWLAFAYPRPWASIKELAAVADRAEWVAIRCGRRLADFRVADLLPAA